MFVYVVWESEEDKSLDNTLSVSALSPCQGRFPRRKYMNMCPRASRSSRRDCSLPKWVLIDMYLAVPVKLLCSLNKNVEIPWQ